MQKKKHVCESLSFSVLCTVIYSRKVQQSLVQPPQNERVMSDGSSQRSQCTLGAEIIVFQLKNVCCFIYRAPLFGAGFMTLHAHFGQLIFMKGSRRGS